MPNIPGKRTPRSPAILRYMRERPNLDVHISDVAQDTGFSESAVSGVLSRGGHNPQSPIQVGHAKGYYRWSTELITIAEPEKKEPMMYEEVGTTRAGVIIVRDEKGQLYMLGEVM